MNERALDRVLAAVRAEHARQDEKFGPNRKLPNLAWLAILTEEVGEAAQATLKASARPENLGFSLRAVLNEVIQSAAVAVAWAEFLVDLTEEEYERAVAGAIA